MLRFIFFRFLTMLGTLTIVSVLVFAIINLPEGDYLSNQINELGAFARQAALAAIPDLGWRRTGPSWLFRADTGRFWLVL